jgi:hypothetical protein
MSGRFREPAVGLVAVKDEDVDASKVQHISVFAAMEDDVACSTPLSSLVLSALPTAQCISG